MITRRRHSWLVVPIAISAVILGAALAFALASEDGIRDAGVSPKASLSEYSWAELASIADEIASCPDEATAFAHTAAYGLCGEGGSLDAGKTKAVELVDGSSVQVMLAGIWHDERTDGGKAGLTFVFAAPADEHAMNHAFENADGDDADSVGGWAASDMRSWLNGDYLLRFPPELRGRIVSVQKLTANSLDTEDELIEAGSLEGTASDWVGETSDRLWLLSAAELCGVVPVHDALGIDQTMADVYAAEGSQYRLFADAGVAAFEPNSLLEWKVGDTPCTWWLRTKTLEFGDGFWLVGTDGTPLNGLGEDARATQDSSFAPEKLWGPDHARAIVAGFCL